VAVHGRRFAAAWGPSKKEAEQKAAYNALIELKQIRPIQATTEAAPAEGKVKEAAAS
jgi:hypothetical protein